MVEENECIICLEKIDEEKGNFRSDICDECFYHVHLDCYDKFEKIRDGVFCLVCGKQMEPSKIEDNYQFVDFGENLYLPPSVYRRRPMYSTTLEQRIFTGVCCGIGTVVAIIYFSFFTY